MDTLTMAWRGNDAGSAGNAGKLRAEAAVPARARVLTRAPAPVAAASPRMPALRACGAQDAPGKQNPQNQQNQQRAASNDLAPARPVQERLADDPVNLCLELWKRWMAGDADRDLGTRTMRGLRGDGDGHGVDLYEAQQASDIKMAEATDAMIGSLERIHVWAIYRACSLATVWAFPNASLVDVAAEARAQLREKLRKNICTGILF
ncbi:hypothetical protein [Massilia aquatica]|uniref:Uncharacterized protein n=1 Tax=Massilia aquatica TaxID=2609000 RepID=A0ABX0M3R2_9BURK|nr:hypothetical protein [Massilia aquatica]NHZ41825.1 hypothetical protein [Massilia aquatica]